MSSPDHIELLYNVTGQALYYDAPEGRASGTPTVTIHEDTEGEDSTALTATTGSASVDSVNTTFDADSGADESPRNKLYLTATTGIVAGRQYRITNALGEVEWPEITSIASGDYVLARAPLTGNYASGDTFQGTRISIGVVDSFIQDRNNRSNSYDIHPRYRMQISYTVSSIAYRKNVYFDVVQDTSTLGITGSDIDAESPGWIDRLPVNDRVGAGERTVRQAIREVKRDLSRHQRSDWALRNQESFHALVIKKAVVIVSRAHWLHGATDATRQVWLDARDDYDLHFKDWVVQSKAATAVSEDGAGGRVPALAFTRR